MEKRVGQCGDWACTYNMGSPIISLLMEKKTMLKKLYLHIIYLISLVIFIICSCCNKTQNKPAQMSVEAFDEVILKAYSQSNKDELRQLIRENRWLLDRQMRKKLDYSVHLHVSGNPDSAKSIEKMEFEFAQIYRSLFRDTRPIKIVELYQSWDFNQKKLKIKADSLQDSGIQYEHKSKYQQALQAAEAAQQLYEELGDLKSFTDQMNNIGIIYGNTAQYQKAIDIYRKAIDNRKKVGDKRGEGATWTNKGTAYNKLGDIDKSEECH